MNKISRIASRLLENVLVLLPVLIISGFVIFGFVRQAWAAQPPDRSNRPAYFIQSASPTPTYTFTPLPVPNTPTPTYTFTPLPVPNTPTPTYTFTPLPVPDTPTPTYTFTPLPIPNTPTPTYTFTPLPVPNTPTPTYTFTPLPVPNTPTPTYTFTPLPVPDTPTPTYTFTPLPVPSTSTPTYTPIPVNTPPEIVYFSPITDPIIEVSESVVFELDVFDPDMNDTFTAVVDWGDGTIDTDSLPEPDPFPVTITHPYNSAGIFTVNLTILDSAGGVDSQPYEYVVVTDPDSGAFLTGAGRIASPEGAYYPDPTVSGPANFAFSARTNRATGAVNCTVQFNLLAADMHYHSQVCDWMVISGERAYLFGQGTINGQGNYNFYLTAVDEGSALTSENDRLRLTIWDDVQIVYDNILPDTGQEQYQPISEGKIKIHR